MTKRAALTIVLVLALAAPARADDVTAAQALYEQAKQLVADGKLADACPVYAASFKADPQLGVLLNLADCNEQIGKTATAWSQFRDAIARAHRANDNREAYAQKRADALAPRLVRLRIVAPSPAPPGLVVTRDDTDVTALVGTDAPVDPGTHAIVATAPGFARWQRSVDVAGEGTTTTAQLDGFVKPGAEAPTATTTATAPPAPSGPRRFGGVRILAGTSASELLTDSGTFQHNGSGRPGIWFGVRADIRIAGRFFVSPSLAFHNRAVGVAVCPTGQPPCTDDTVLLNDIEVYALARYAFVDRHTQVAVLAGPYLVIHGRSVNDGPQPTPDPAQQVGNADVGYAAAFELFVGRVGGQILLEVVPAPSSSLLMFGLGAMIGVRI